MRRALLLGLLLIGITTAQAAQAQATSSEACGSRLRLLTLNLAFWAVDGRDARLEALATFIEHEAVDVVALQEVAGGLLLFSDDTAAELQRRLEQHGVAMQRRTAFAETIGRLIAVGNALLSRCPIKDTTVVPLPEIAEIKRLGMAFAIGRNLLEATIETGVGPLRLATTHLCADCTVDERRTQLDVVLGRKVILLAGDLNIDRHRDDGLELPLYAALQAAGYEDSLALARGTTALCPGPATPAPDCTTGVTLLNGPSTRRVDYVWIGDGLRVIDARTVLNPLVDPRQPGISDHAGVLVTLQLAP